METGRQLKAGQAFSTATALIYLKKGMSWAVIITVWVQPEQSIRMVSWWNRLLTLGRAIGIRLKKQSL